MGRFGAWLWRKHPRLFVEWLALGATVFFGVFLAAPSVAVAGIYLDLTLNETVIWGASLATSMTVSVGISMLYVRRRTAPVRAWVDGDHSDPLEVWRTLLRLPTWFAGCVLTIAFVIDTLGSYTVGLALADQGPPAAAGLLYAYVLVHVIAGVYFASCVQLGVRPAIVDVSNYLTVPARDSLSWWTIRRRLVIGCFGGVAITAYVTPIMILGGAAEQSDYLIAGLGGCALAAYIGWLLNAGMIRPTVLPVQDLTRGTIRVRKGDVGTPVPVASHDELGELAVAFNEMQRGLQERESLQHAFGSYVDPSLAQRLLESGSSVFEGEEVEVTVMFADVRSFTRYAEQVAPAEAVALLNSLFDVIVPVIHEAGGHTNHYLGDGLLAVFGAPQPLAAHAEAAVAAAIACNAPSTRNSATTSASVSASIQAR